MVFTIHAAPDPEAFCGGKLDLPKGTELPIVVPVLVAGPYVARALR